MLTERETKIAELAIQGYSQREIGNAVGMCQQNVSRILKTDEVKAMLEQAQQTIATGAQVAADNMIETAKYYNDYVTKARRGEKPEREPDRQLIDLGFKASKEIGKATGSLSGDTTSVFIQNVYTQNNTMISPEMKKLLEDFHRRALEMDDD